METIETLGVKITETSKALFVAYAKDCGNWNGMPMVGGNVITGKSERGNLTQLKKAGLIETNKDEGETWVIFTEKGVKYALLLGIDLCSYYPQYIKDAAKKVAEAKAALSSSPAEQVAEELRKAPELKDVPVVVNEGKAPEQASIVIEKLTQADEEKLIRQAITKMVEACLKSDQLAGKISKRDARLGVIKVLTEDLSLRDDVVAAVAYDFKEEK